MRTAIFDLETSNLSPEWGIILCCCVKEFGKSGVKEFRGDRFPTWKHRRSDDHLLVKAVLEELEQYDILVAHNGAKFDRGWLLAKAAKYGIPSTLKFKKFIDPWRVSRNGFAMGSNGLQSLINFLGVKTTKTRIEPEMWLKAGLDGDSKAMDVIVYHCNRDVVSLNGVYNKMRHLVERIDNRGSSN